MNISRNLRKRLSKASRNLRGCCTNVKQPCREGREGGEGGGEGREGGEGGGEGRREGTGKAKSLADPSRGIYFSRLKVHCFVRCY